MGKIIIYGLVDPRTHLVRYVGKTNNLAKRMREHLCDAPRFSHYPVKKWINKLAKAGLQPTPIILAVVPSEQSWQEQERLWISRFQDLLNCTEGGDGVHDPDGIIARKISESKKAKNYKHSEETKAKLRAARNKRPPATDEYRRKMAILSTGRPVSEETRMKLSSALKGRQFSEESREKMRQSRLNYLSQTTH